MIEELTPKQVATGADLRLDYVYSLLWGGRIKGRQENGRWFIAKSEADKLLKARRARQSRVRRAEGDTNKPSLVVGGLA